jgi:type IV secretory pathway VirB4 component
MTGLSVLLQSNALRQALAPYVLGGAHGKLLDADHDRLGMADVQCFEMEELMHSKAAVMAVLATSLRASMNASTGRPRC